MTATRVLAVDAGKSSCRAALFAERRGPTRTGPGFENVAAPGGLAQIRAALEEVLAGLGPLGPLDGVCVGLTGLLPPSRHAEAVAALVADLVAGARVQVTSDVATAYAGALGLRPGVVVAAGTGAITLAAGPTGATARVDGWGYLLDDAGSAFAIGRAGLREALRAADGRGGSAALHAAALERYGDVGAIPEAVYGAANPARAVAGFARTVGAVAAAGDPVAAALLAEAGTALAASAASAARRVLDVDEPVAVAWHGGVFAAGAAVREPFLGALRAALPTAVPTPAAGDALDGAAALARAADPTVLDAVVTTRQAVAA